MAEALNDIKVAKAIRDRCPPESVLPEKPGKDASRKVMVMYEHYCDKIARRRVRWEVARREIYD